MPTGPFITVTRPRRTRPAASPPLPICWPVKGAAFTMQSSPATLSRNGNFCGGNIREVRCGEGCWWRKRRSNSRTCTIAAPSSRMHGRFLSRYSHVPVTEQARSSLDGISQEERARATSPNQRYRSTVADARRSEQPDIVHPARQRPTFESTSATPAETLPAREHKGLTYSSPVERSC